LPRLVGLLCTALAFAFALAFAARGSVSDLGRGALWQVIHACLINHALTSAAFPCLEVHVPDGDESGYVILRPTWKAFDLLWAPTRKIVGVEDPSLETLDAPNYFEDAWNARKFLEEALRRPIARDDVVLAVNSRQARTQDQLHIHIGCLTTRLRQTIHALAPSLPENRWIPLRTPFNEYWGRLLVKDNLADVNPFRLAAEGRPTQSKDRTQTTIAVAGIKLSDGREGFVLLASYDNPFGAFSAEDFLDYSASRCR
jgi:CDP-diacylglycerol pyrophosphatase